MGSSNIIGNNFPSGNSGSDTSTYGRVFEQSSSDSNKSSNESSNDSKSNKSKYW